MSDEKLYKVQVQTSTYEDKKVVETTTLSSTQRMYIAIWEGQAGRILQVSLADNRVVALYQDWDNAQVLES